MKTPCYQDIHSTLYQMDFRANDLPDESVQMVVTSPPYWGLRKYSGEQNLIWGGDENCEHEWGKAKVTKKGHAGTKSTLVGTQTAEISKAADTFGSDCLLCGALKCGYGLEPTPEMYVRHTIEILREIRRVLRKDGVVFWNIGDSYANDTKWGGQSGGKNSTSAAGGYPRERTHTGQKSKDLCLIPFRIAIAVQDDGWWVRSVIIWSKPNPMPESVTDRPTESHEYILMLTKSARYYWDQEAVREKQTGNAHSRGRGNGDEDYNKARDSYKGFSSTLKDLPAGRNLRSVWSFPTKPFPEAHFAVFPEKLPELCIKAATPEVGCCAECGRPWVRITEKVNPHSASWAPGTRKAPIQASGQHGKTSILNTDIEYDTKTTGWQPTCKCNADKVPSIVLDPFAGAGTTLWVAKKLNRKGIGFDISEEYCDLAVDRIRQQVML